MKYAAVYFSAVSTPGYDRNDPPGSVEVANIKEFTTLPELEAWLVRQRQSYPHQKIRTIQFEELQYELKAVLVRK